MVYSQHCHCLVQLAMDYSQHGYFMSGAVMLWFYSQHCHVWCSYVMIDSQHCYVWCSYVMVDNHYCCVIVNSQYCNVWCICSFSDNTAMSGAVMFWFTINTVILMTVMVYKHHCHVQCSHGLQTTLLCLGRLWFSQHFYYLFNHGLLSILPCRVQLWFTANTSCLVQF